MPSEMRIEIEDAVRDVKGYRLITNVVRCGCVKVEVGSSASPAFSAYFGLSLECGEVHVGGSDVVVLGDDVADDLVAALRYAASVIEDRARAAAVERVTLEGRSERDKGA